MWANDVISHRGLVTIASEVEFLLSIILFRSFTKRDQQLFGIGLSSSGIGSSPNVSVHDNSNNVNAIEPINANETTNFKLI